MKDNRKEKNDQTKPEFFTHWKKDQLIDECVWLNFVLTMCKDCKFHTSKPLTDRYTHIPGTCKQCGDVAMEGQDWCTSCWMTP